MYPRNSPLTDEAIANLLGLAELRIGRHSPESENPAGDGDFWIQSIWRARVLPAFDADAFLAVVTCAKPWQGLRTRDRGFGHDPLDSLAAPWLIP